MSLGVLNNISAVYAENALNNSNNDLSKTLQQLSSGSRINSGADDAAGLSLVDGLEANQTALTQSQTNAQEGVGLLQVADGALSQVTSLLNRAVTLATEAANGTLNATQDTAADQEYQSILSEINNIGTTTTYNNQAVFNSATNIYTGDASSKGSSIDDLNIRGLSSTNVGDTQGAMSYSNGSNNVFLDLSLGGKYASVSDSLGNSSADTSTIAVSYMTKGANGSAVQAAANITVGAGTNYSNTVQGLISAINGAGLGLSATFGTAAQAGTNAVAAATGAETTTGGSANDTGIIISGASIGANTSGTNGVGVIGTLNLTADTTAHVNAGTLTSGTLNVVDSNGVSHTVTLGQANSTDTLANLAATINSMGWGVTASYAAATTGTTATLTFTSASSQASVSQTSATLGYGGTGVSGESLANLPTATGAQQNSIIGTIATGGGAAGGTAPGSISFGTTGAEGSLAISTTETAAQLVSAINAGKFGVTAAVSGNNVVLTSANSNETVNFTDTTGGAWTLSTTANSTSSAYYGIGVSVSNDIGGTASSNIKDTSTNGGTANVGVVGDNNGASGVATINYSDSAGQSLAATDLSNAADAQAALTALNSAIADVAAQDGYIGAQINTLNAVSNVLSTQQENVQSAQNAVQATDYAAASSDMSKYEILSQTGISALAQANSTQQEVLKLLQ